MIERIEDSLNGGYGGLFGEVYDEDIYRLRKLTFTPDVIFDCGANVGIFTRLARELFPMALIVSVEPNKENFSILEKFVENIKGKTVLLNKAIGVGTVWHYKDAKNGAHECYLSDGVGYDRNLLANEEMIGGCIEIAKVETIMPDELVREYVKEGQKYIFKIDIEGNEIILWSHELSIEALHNAEYLCMEVHFYALHGKAEKEVRDKTNEGLKAFNKTHKCELNHIHFWALKKQYADTAQNTTS